MTENDLWAQAEKLKTLYANNLNTQKQNSMNDLNASRQSYINDANAQLKTQQDTTDTGRVDADITANNENKLLRELAARNGFSNGGELLTGVLHNNQDKSNKVNNYNRIMGEYKKNWDTNMNNYNNSYNNKVNALNSETANKIAEYNTNTDWEFKNKVDSLRAEQARAAAAAAKASKAKELTAAELLDQAKYELKNAMKTNQGYMYLKNNEEALRATLGQTKYDELYNYYYKNSESPDLIHYNGGNTAIDTVKNYSKNLGYTGVDPAIWKVNN